MKKKLSKIFENYYSISSKEDLICQDKIGEHY